MLVDRSPSSADEHCGALWLVSLRSACIPAGASICAEDPRSLV